MYVRSYSVDSRASRVLISMARCSSGGDMASTLLTKKMLEGITITSAKLNGITIRFASAGQNDPSATAVLFCHGWPESWFSWRHQMQAVAAAGYFAIAPDMRGFGGTDAPHDPSQYDHFVHIAKDLLAVLNHFDRKTAVICGHDWGAAIAWNMALAHPTVFPKVCCMSVPFSKKGFTLPLLKRSFNWKEGANRAENFFYMLYHNEVDETTGNLVAAQEYSRNPRLFFEQMMATCGDVEWEQQHTNQPAVEMSAPREKGGFLERLKTLKDPKVLPPWITSDEIDYFAQEYTTHGFSGGLNYYRSFDYTNRSASAYKHPQILQPALFIGGERDGVTVMSGGKLAINKNMTKLVPNCDMVWLDCGHWIQAEKVHEVNEALLKFLGQHNSKL
eukprot:m.18000 g.18000  ORF g.18000 m.18000 type:complete len:388 (+) comp11779_c0_seq1:27-1190(+)